MTGGKVTGSLDDTEVMGTYADGKLSLSFPYYSEDAGVRANLKITGTVSGDKMTGNWEFDQYFGTFTAARAE